MRLSRCSRSRRCPVPTDVRRTSRRFLPATALIVLLASGLPAPRKTRRPPRPSERSSRATRRRRTAEPRRSPSRSRPSGRRSCPRSSRNFRRSQRLPARGGLRGRPRGVPPVPARGGPRGSPRGDGRGRSLGNLPMALRVLGAVGGDGSLAVLLQLRSRFDNATLAGSAVKGAIVDALAGILAPGGKALAGVEEAYAGGDETCGRRSSTHWSGPEDPKPSARWPGSSPRVLPSGRPILRRLLRMPVLGVEPVGKRSRPQSRSSSATGPPRRGRSPPCASRDSTSSPASSAGGRARGPLGGRRPGGQQGTRGAHAGFDFPGAPAFAAWLGEEGEWLGRGSRTSSRRSAWANRNGSRKSSAASLAASSTETVSSRPVCLHTAVRERRRSPCRLRRTRTARGARVDPDSPPCPLGRGREGEGPRHDGPRAVTRLPPSDDPALWHERLNKWAAAAGGAR